MKQTIRELCDDTIAARVEDLVNQWHENETQSERRADRKLNEQMDRWMKKLNKEQKQGVETCIDSILEGNGVCQTYLYEEGVKDGIRLMKMIHGM